MSSSIYMLQFNLILKSDCIKKSYNPSNAPILVFFFLTKQHTEVTSLPLQSHFIKPTSPLPLIFNASSFHPQEYICCRNKPLYCWKPETALKSNCDGRADCQKSGTALAAAAVANWLWCCSDLSAYFFLHICLFYHSAQLSEEAAGLCPGWAYGCFYLALLSIIHEFVSM